MAEDGVSAKREMLSEALRAMQSALDLLDRANAPAQIGARLDHAICELQSAMTGGESADRPAAANGVWSQEQP
jgi:hypothetical protein